MFICVNSFRLILATTIVLTLTACLRLPSSMPLPPDPSATPLPPTATPTTTPVWFPPIATFTPLPLTTRSLPPTADLSPHFGSLVFSDDFMKPELWTLGRGPAGGAAFGKGELSLVVNQPHAYLSSLRQETGLGDFYLEITASANICRGGDEYGLLVRQKSPQDFFRFGLTCRGEARLDRVLSGTASSPYPPKPYGSVPPGAPSVSTLAVWAMGKELRYYANGQFLFATNDASLPTGGIGVYARAIGDDSVSVSFSNLSVYKPEK